ncbi:MULTISPECIES: metallophosphoesterase [Pyrobaculum]|uniref:Metallophosphoesterase n=2 Tax=Pyrobaculum arsenaticum TaxID=121277 RepID=A4WK20_PYRAR|nr:metallophosphoesterase [Pyrobaculum arsenaticum]ABP50737.1 metallophosphoesterase [Pyrobaculum arsenaticum DSM 13514]MCY0891258.1 metallophosphoesterase [Pyrobaculum arsenaticum]NYR15546.1 metallophosphoesterase [Pyrobaculum arsenaticum]
MKKLFSLSILLLVALLSAASIVDPRWGTPAYVTPGGAFNITLDAAVAIKSVALAAPGLEKPIELNYATSGNVITAKVPPGTPLGVYDLVINEGELYEPKAVWVGNVTGPLRIIQLTDIHVGVELDMASLYRLIHGALVASGGPYDVVFFTGDLADVGGQVWHYTLFTKYAATIPKPVFAIPGNHDHAGDDPLTNYQKFVGRPVWYRVIGPYLIIGLDSGFDGYLRDDQVKMYEEVLKRYPDKVKIVLIHHPPFYLQDSYVVETYRGPQDVDRLNKDPTGRRSYYIVYTSYLQNRPAFEKFLDLTIRYKVALVMAGHVHSGNSTIVINGTYFVTTRTLGGSIDTSHGFRTYVVYPDGRVEVDKELWTFKNFTVLTWGTKAAQIYAESSLLPPTITIDLPGEFAGLKVFNGTAELVKAERHPLGKYTRYTLKIAGKRLWLALGDYQPSPTVEVVRILPRSPTPGDVVTVTIRATDPNVGVPFITVNGQRILASYLEEQPVYIYKFKYTAPTTLQAAAPSGKPLSLQIGQPTTTTPPTPTPPPTTTTTPQTTTVTTTPSATPTATPTTQTATSPTATPSATAPPATTQPTPAPTAAATATPAPSYQPSAFPVEAVILLVIAVAGAAVIAVTARKKPTSEEAKTR